MEINLSEKIKLTIRRRGLKIGDLAEFLKCTRQNVNMKMIRNSWTEEDLKLVAEFLGCDLKIVFIDKNTGEEY